MTKYIDTSKSHLVGLDIYDHHGIVAQLVCNVGGWITPEGNADSLREYINPKYKLVGREIPFETTRRI